MGNLDSRTAAGSSVDRKHPIAAEVLVRGFVSQLERQVTALPARVGTHRRPAKAALTPPVPHTRSWEGHDPDLIACRLDYQEAEDAAIETIIARFRRPA